MSDTKRRYPRIAIDLGTTRIKVAWYDEQRKKPSLIKLGDGGRNTIPLAFYVPLVKDGEIRCGDAALAYSDTDPVGIVRQIRREIDNAGVIRCGPGRHKPTRIELATLLLSDIKSRVENNVFRGQKVSHCTLTVPVSFSESQRTALRRAAIAAGFDNCQLIDEPIAAVRAWSEAGRNGASGAVVVCDVGGRESNFSVVTWDDADCATHTAVAPECFPRGCNDIDDAACDAFLECQEEADERVFSSARTALLAKLGKVKKQYASGVKRQAIPCGRKQIDVPNRIFDAATGDFLNQLVSGLEKYLSKCTASGVGTLSVLLVGGGSRVAGLQERIERLAPKQVYTWENAKYAAALGAVDSPRSKGTFTSLKDRQARDAYAEALKAAIADNVVTLNESNYLKSRRDALGILPSIGEEIEKAILGTPLAKTKVIDESIPVCTPPSLVVVRQVEKLIESDRLVEALDVLSEAIDRDHSVGAYFALKARIYMLREKTEMASASASAALRLIPNDYASMLIRGQCHLATRSLEFARKDLTLVASKCPDLCRESSFYLAASYCVSQDYATSAGHLSRIVDVPKNPGSVTDPPSEFVSFILSLHLLHFNNSKEAAIQHLQKSLDRKPEDLSHLSAHHFIRLTRDYFSELLPTSARNFLTTNASESPARWQTILESQAFRAHTLLEASMESAIEKYGEVLRRHRRTFASMPLFASSDAVAYAAVEASKHAAHEEEEVDALVTWLVKTPGFDLTKLHKPTLLSLSSVRALIEPMFSASEAHTSKCNFIDVTNRSAFPVNNVVIVATVVRKNGSTSTVTESTDKLDAGKSVRWTKCFKKIHFLLHSRIKSVSLAVTCRESLPECIEVKAQKLDRIEVVTEPGGDSRKLLDPVASIGQTGNGVRMDPSKTAATNRTSPLRVLLLIAIIGVLAALTIFNAQRALRVQAVSERMAILDNLRMREDASSLHPQYNQSPVPLTDNSPAIAHREEAGSTKPITIQQDAAGELSTAAIPITHQETTYSLVENWKAGRFELVVEQCDARDISLSPIKYLKCWALAKQGNYEAVVAVHRELVRTSAPNATERNADIALAFLAMALEVDLLLDAEANEGDSITTQEKASKMVNMLDRAIWLDPSLKDAVVARNNIVKSGVFKDLSSDSVSQEHSSDRATDALVNLPFRAWWNQEMSKYSLAAYVSMKDGYVYLETARGEKPKREQLDSLSELDQVWIYENIESGQ